MQDFIPFSMKISDFSLNNNPTRLAPRDIGPRDYIIVKDLRVTLENTASVTILTIGFGDMVASPDSENNDDPFQLKFDNDWKPGILLSNREWTSGMGQLFGVDGSGGFGQPLGLRMNLEGDSGKAHILYSYKLIQG